MKLIAQTENSINWDSVILSLDQKPGTVLRYNRQTFNPELEDFSKMDNVWRKAGYQYDDESIEWINYFPRVDFDQTVVDKFQTIVGAQPWMVWISKIRPGKMAPWHFDAHSKLDELLKLGEPVRYTCYIQDPHEAHISIVGNEVIYKPVKGSVYEWSNYNDWHCGMNGGLADKFMFNYWGYK